MNGKERYEQEQKRREEIQEAKKRWMESEAILSILRTPKGTEIQPTDEEILAWNRQF